MIADTWWQTLLVLSFPLMFGVAALIVYIRPVDSDNDGIDTSPETLCYCSSCGCRHRQSWMQWQEGIYRCIVCCHVEG